MTSSVFLITVVPPSRFMQGAGGSGEDGDGEAGESRAAASRLWSSVSRGPQHRECQRL